MTFQSGLTNHFCFDYPGVAGVTGVQSHHPDFELVFCVFESPLVHKPGCLSQGALKQTQESHPSPNLSQGALKQTQESHPSPK